MHNILIIGAGLSSGALVRYVLENAETFGWHVTVADADPHKAQRQIEGYPKARTAWLDVLKINDRRDLISRADVVVSLIPAHLHLEVALDCIKLRKHLITASYVSQEMYRLGDEARDRELIFMGEMGLDPGIDHMSAMRLIEKIKAEGGKITAFKSYTGGLIANESDDNPWHYKFTWNPRNVVLAGQGTAQYLENGKLKYLPYQRLFREKRIVDILNMGPLEMYANRDSLLYTHTYGLAGIPNIIRGTLRYPGFCDAWDALVQIGLTDADFPILNSGDISYYELIDAYVSNYSGSTIRERVARLLGKSSQDPVMDQLEWLGLFRRNKIKTDYATPARILENLLREKWALQPEDKDMIIMQHEVTYEKNGKELVRISSMKLIGNNASDTAMSRTVGLPLGIFVKLVMQGRISARGVHIPVMREVYEPVLQELEENFGIEFQEQTLELN